jgi:hypothetical protein
MIVIDPGHKYKLLVLDGTNDELLTFVKREGEKYPGNVGHYPGTTLQECWRAEINRLLYLNQQDPCIETEMAIKHLRLNIMLLEQRAARRHGRESPVAYNDRILHRIETLSVCERCGHIGCEGTCHG